MERWRQRLIGTRRPRRGPTKSKRTIFININFENTAIYDAHSVNRICLDCTSHMRTCVDAYMRALSIYIQLSIYFIPAACLCKHV